MPHGADLRGRADAVGPLPRVIDAGAAFVARNRRPLPRVEGIRRVDVPEYPDVSGREAIAKAVAHRDWSLDGANVRLFIFDDRLEIWSPDKLPPPITLERLDFDRFSRNKVIARVLMELGYIKEVGPGIRQMREEAARLHPHGPEFREDGFSFVVTFRGIAPREGSRPRRTRSRPCWTGARSTSASIPGCSSSESMALSPAGPTWISREHRHGRRRATWRT